MLTYNTGRGSKAGIWGSRQHHGNRSNGTGPQNLEGAKMHEQDEDSPARKGIADGHKARSDWPDRLTGFVSSGELERLDLG